MADDAVAGLELTRVMEEAAVLVDGVDPTVDAVDETTAPVGLATAPVFWGLEA